MPLVTILKKILSPDWLYGHSHATNKYALNYVTSCIVEI